MILTRCPDREVLSDYTVGRLSPDQWGEVATHIESCDDCQAELMTLEDTGDTLLSALRKAGDEPCLREPLFEVAMEEAIRLPQQAASPASQTSSFVPRVLGEYELVEELGRGGMGRVFKARHTKLDRTVAVKILPRGRLDDERAIQRFEREMRAIGRLNHPHVVHAYDAREIDHMPVLIMEYVDGMDLEQLARRLGALPVAEACEIVRQTALGLQYAHEHGLVHRDIKPSNIMLTRDGNVKVMDLGLARFCVEPRGDEMTHEGQMMGTADYVAPEQVDDSRMVDIRADIYSLGCTLYRLLAGRPPYSGPGFRGVFDKLDAHVHQPVPPITHHVPGLPAELTVILDRMLAKQPEDRFDTPAAVVEALEPLARGADTGPLVEEARSVVVPPASATYPSNELAKASPGKSQPVAPVRRSPVSRWLLAVAALVLVGAGFAAGVVVTIYRNGKATQIEVPDGSHMRVDAQGNVDVVLPPEVAGDAAEEQTAAEPDMQALEGVWVVVGMNGESPPDKSLPEMKFAFAKARFSYHIGTTATLAGDIHINSATDPKSIDLIGTEEAEEPKRTVDLLGIYRLEDGRLWLALENTSQGKRPTSFEFEPGVSVHTIFELRRSDEPLPTAEELAASLAATATLKSETLERLKIIGVAMHMYHDQHKSFPPAVLLGPDGQTPYSWRVALLPFLGHQELYDRYRRDEPWDSPHNLQLLNEMPDMYRAPGAPKDATESSVFALVGRGTAFSSPHEGCSFADMVDGTSNTILLVRAQRVIPWTQPEDIGYDLQMALPSLGGFYANGFHALFADGAVHFLPNSLDESLLRAMITRGGGEPYEFPPPETPQPLPPFAAVPEVKKPAEEMPSMPVHMFLVTVDTNGQLELNGSPITKEVLLKEVRDAARRGGVDVQLRVAPELQQRRVQELLDQLKAAGAASVSVSHALRNASNASPRPARLDFRIAPVVALAQGESGGADQPNILTPQTTLPAALVEEYIKDLASQGPRAVSSLQLQGDATDSFPCAWFEVMGALPQSEIVTGWHEGQAYVLLSTRPEDVLRSGDAQKPWSVEEAKAILDEYGQPCISLQLDDAGGAALSTLSKNHIGDHLAILVNDRVVTVPRLVSAVGQKLRITGSFTQQQVKDLVRMLTGATEEEGPEDAELPRESGYAQ